jgi:hypothetical protein
MLSPIRPIRTRGNPRKLPRINCACRFAILKQVRLVRRRVGLLRALHWNELFEHTHQL